MGLGGEVGGADEEVRVLGVEAVGVEVVPSGDFWGRGGGGVEAHGLDVVSCGVVEVGWFSFASFFLALMPGDV